jgi:broad specificity phosphatase PhoE
MIMAGAATSILPGLTPAAHAQLVQFPCPKGLQNNYHFMRAGESLLEADNKLGTNPLFLTNRENGLSALGQEQVHAAAQLMEQQSINPSVVKFSLAANAMDTADIVGDDLQVSIYVLHTVY